MNLACENKTSGAHACLVKKIGERGEVLGSVTVLNKTIVESAIEASKTLGCGRFHVWLPNSSVYHDVTTREETRIVAGPLRDASCEVD